MKEIFSVSPDKIYEGTQITIVIHAPIKNTLNFLEIDSNKQKLEVPIKVRGDEYLAEFSLYKAGTYQISLNGMSKTLIVEPQKDLSFGVEFGILASTVLTILGGLILWNRNKKLKREVGSI